MNQPAHPSRPAPAARRPWLRRPGAALLGGAALLLAFDASRAVDAAWPPPPDATPATLKDPANWPNDPSYGYRASARASEREAGQWELYSFLPDRSPGAPPVRGAETAAGMSVDMAWRHTIGDDRVLIAVLDSGIKWDERDLLDKAYLNKRELGKASQRPTHADGSACAPLDAGRPTEDLYDCNGDGIFSVSDYSETPGVTDLNQNGVLDAGDLIVAFSDGVDDDGNGYVDDISGWDFMKNDNDPYDDTRYGHGTGEARDSSAAANNGIGSAGICAQCRFVPLRVGDSFIADVNDYAKSVIYATDNGASVIQEALGTINMSRFAQDAMDYAYARGAIVIASMADENSRHHNLPAAANHTLPVHAIEMLGSGQQSTTAESFLAFNNCSNYGAQNFLSASGVSCSSEATGNLSGITGLVFSMGLEAGYGAGGAHPALTAGEVMQLLMMTADDIDVPESRGEEPRHRWSQPGFDQRFGYGRVNANAAVEQVAAGRIPPEVDVVKPYWFEVLYKDQVTAPVPLLGTVSAKRAPSYDYVVEWAPGVQPLDDAFTVIKSVPNVPGGTVTGADGTPLAELDLSTIDATHEPDPDSPLGENRYTFTVRVRSVAHYGGSIGDVKGELRRAYYLYEDPDLLPGFPIYLGASGESNPKMADIDGDGVRDLVVGTASGELHVFSMASGKAAPVAGFPFRARPIDGLDASPAPNGADYRQAPAYRDAALGLSSVARESISATPAIADLDGDGKPEIVFTTFGGTLYIVRADGTAFPGWPVRMPEVPSCPLDAATPKPEQCMDTETRIARGAFGSPVLVDMNKDGKLDIVQGSFDGKVYVYQQDGSVLPGWPVAVRFPNNSKEFGRVFTTPAVADFTGDGIPDVLVGSNERLGAGSGAGAFYVIDGRGTAAGQRPYLPNWPVGMTSLNIFPLVAEGVGNSPVIADVDGDGKPDAIMHGNASAPLILPGDPGAQSGLSGTPANAIPVRLDSNGNEEGRGLEPTAFFGASSKALRPDTMLPLFAQPSVGDLNMDGTPDIITAGGSLSMAQSLFAKGPSSGTAQQLVGMWDGKTGKMLPGSPALIEDFSFFNSQAVADITNDGYPEVLVGSAGYYLHAFDGCALEAPGWPKFTGQWIAATPAVGDITGAGTLDVAVPTRAGWLYAWRTPGKADGVVQWESFHHDNRNTGDYSVALEHGTKTSDVGPRPVDADGACIAKQDPPPATQDEDDGCGCAVPGRATGSATLTLLLLPLAALLRRRRR